MPLHLWLFLLSCAARFRTMAVGRKEGNRIGLVRGARGVLRARCCVAVDRWQSCRWWQGLCFSGCSSWDGRLFSFGLMGLEPTADGRETVSRARLVCRVREKSRAGCCAVVDRREFG